MFRRMGVIIVEGRNIIIEPRFGNSPQHKGESVVATPTQLDGDEVEKPPLPVALVEVLNSTAGVQTQTLVSYSE